MILEKLFEVLVIVAEALEVAALKKTVTVPPILLLVKVPTIALEETVCVPEAGNATLFEIKLTFPVVATLKLVKVLVLMFWDSVAKLLII